MKNLVLIFASVLLVSYTLSAQVSNSGSQQLAPEQKKNMPVQQQNAAEPDNPNAPVIEFDKLVHDYGEIQQHDNGKCEFKFTNKGKEPLMLSNVRSSCGCTVPEWPRQPILPGQSEVIKVKYDTKRIGMINKSVHVYSNAKKSPISLKIKGKVLAQSESNMPEKSVSNEGSPVNK
jgi:hypothetical protein